MVWIKRNLFFVISAAVGLILTGYCIYLLCSSLNANAGVSDEYKNTKSALDAFDGKVPFPSEENIKAAKEDQEKVRQFLSEFGKRFASFPPPPREDDKGFKDYLANSIVQFRAQATNAGVRLPEDFGFSFSGLMGRLNYPPASVAAWMQELQEISAILDILYQAKINSLTSLCRVPVGDDGGSGDCLLQTTSSTNLWGIVTPYKITFRGFSTEIAAVMEGFARSSNCFIIKTIDVLPDTSVQPIAVEQASQPSQPRYAPPPPRYQNPNQNREDRMRGSPGPRPTPTTYVPPPAVPTVVAALSAPPVMILTENPLVVTMSVEVVKLKPTEH